jgi:hypothetical protein
VGGAIDDLRANNGTLSGGVQRSVSLGQTANEPDADRSSNKRLDTNTLGPETFRTVMLISKK